MYERLYKFVGKFKILYPSQINFRANYSINNSLVGLTDAIKNSLDSKKFGYGIFLDF